jgi:hypothetical protein
MTEEEATQKALELVREGWEILSLDDPERATRGFLAFRRLGDDEEEQFLEWPLFNQPLIPDKREVTPIELADFIEGSSPVHLCDDPKRLRMGFVKYEPDEGRAVVRQSRITALKEHLEVGRKILEFRSPLLRTYNQFCEERRKVALALSTGS